jgi:iron-sulfur cluster assembly protein
MNMNGPMITVTETALSHIHQLREEQGYDEHYGLRVSVVGGGCSGLSYKLDFDKDMTEGDQVIEDKGIRIFVNMKSLLYLVGTELDYSGGLTGEGFHFKNPNASRTCACGESFSV